MTNYGFIIDNRKCIGCHACTVACKQEHDLPIGVNRTWVKYVEKGEFPATRGVFSVQRCNHCEDAPCVEICPVSSLYTRKDGIVDFDGDRCIGCKACMQACPYDAIYIHPDNQTAAKCNYCAIAWKSAWPRRASTCAGACDYSGRHGGSVHGNCANVVPSPGPGQKAGKRDAPQGLLH